MDVVQGTTLTWPARTIIRDVHSQYEFLWLWLALTRSNSEHWRVTCRKMDTRPHPTVVNELSLFSLRPVLKIGFKSRYNGCESTHFSLHYNYLDSLMGVGKIFGNKTNNIRETRRPNLYICVGAQKSIGGSYKRPTASRLRH